jgi:hypothetical protein
VGVMPLSDLDLVREMIKHERELREAGDKAHQTALDLAVSETRAASERQWKLVALALAALTLLLKFLPGGGH